MLKGLFWKNISCFILAILLVLGLIAACGSGDDDDEPIDGDEPVDGDEPADGDEPTDGDEPADGDEPGDGTWLDPDTGLRWQNPGTEPDTDLLWDEAIAYCDDLTHAGYDDWRLPTIDELRTLIRGCPDSESAGACALTDECTALNCINDTACDGCEDNQGPDDGCYWASELDGHCMHYWSISESEDPWVLFVYYKAAGIGYTDKGDTNSARCVR